MESFSLHQETNQISQNSTVINQQSENIELSSQIEVKLEEANTLLNSLKQNNKENDLKILEECLSETVDVIAKNKKMQEHIEVLQNVLKSEEDKQEEITKRCSILEQENQEFNTVLQKNHKMFEEMAHLKRELASTQKYLSELEEHLNMNNDKQIIESYKSQVQILNQEMMRMQEEADIQKKLCVEIYTKQENTKEELENSINKIKTLKNEIIELNFVIDRLNRDNDRYRQELGEASSKYNLETENKVKLKTEEKNSADNNNKIIEKKENKQKNEKLEEKELDLTDNLERLEKNVSIKGNKIKYLKKQIFKLHQDLAIHGKSRTIK